MPRPKSRFKKRRINLELPVSTVNKLLSIETKLRADSMTEAVRRAVDIAALLMLEYARGGVVEIRKEDGTKERIHVL